MFAQSQMLLLLLSLAGSTVLLEHADLVIAQREFECVLFFLLLFKFEGGRPQQRRARSQ